MSRVTERTEFQIAFDDDIIYLAVRAHDSAPETLVAMEMERDAELYQDDSVAIVLDTFFDRRNTCSFETNPNCTRTDVLISDEGRGSAGPRHRLEKSSAPQDVVPEDLTRPQIW